MTAQALFDFNAKTGVLSRDGIVVTLKPRHVRLFAALNAAGIDLYVKTDVLAEHIDVPQPQIGVEVHHLRLRLVKLAIEIQAKRLHGYRIVVHQITKWQPNIPPPVRLEGETHSRAKPCYRTESIPWTSAEINRLMTMHDDGVHFTVIARALRRGAKPVLSKIRYELDRRVRDNKAPARAKIAPQQEAERLLRRDGYDARDITSTFFGDPPRGFSALDQKRSQS